MKVRLAGQNIFIWRILSCRSEFSRKIRDEVGKFDCAYQALQAFDAIRKCTNIREQ